MIRNSEYATTLLESGNLEEYFRFAEELKKSDIRRFNKTINIFSGEANSESKAEAKRIVENKRRYSPTPGSPSFFYKM